MSQILVSSEAILKRFYVRINFTSQFQSNDQPQAIKHIKIASKLTSIVTILASITLAGDHIFQVLGKYSWVLPQYLRVLSQYLRVLSRWIHPLILIMSLQSIIYNMFNFRFYYVTLCLRFCSSQLKRDYCVKSRAYKQRQCYKMSWNEENNGITP